MTFIETIYEKAKANKKTVAVPESTNEVMIKASARIQAAGLARQIAMNPNFGTKSRATAPLPIISITPASTANIEKPIPWIRNLTIFTSASGT